MKKIYIYSLVAAMFAASLAGCSSKTAAERNYKSETKEKTSVVSEKNESASVAQLSNTEESTYTKRDLEQTADTSEAQYITVSDGENVSITSEGVYVISGTAEGCTIRVEADENAKVQLVLDGVSIENSDSPAIYVVSADKVFITTSDSENILTVSGEFKADGETNTDAVIFSKDDLVLNGTGTLNVTSYYGNGITSKDDMKITGGTYNVKSALDAFEANDSISVSDGTFNIATNKDGFHCENDEAEGTVTISGGTFSINGGSDGIQACSLLQIDGGTMTIQAPEGLEAAYILINDGDININSSDDGVNVSKKSSSVTTPTFEINGGSLSIAMSGNDVDGIDANGNIIVSGGTIDITYPQQGPSESFDYDGSAEFNGGTVIINGTEVSEIPSAMMGGGMHGGMNGGIQGGFGGRGGRF